MEPARGETSRRALRFGGGKTGLFHPGLFHHDQHHRPISCGGPRMLRPRFIRVFTVVAAVALTAGLAVSCSEKKKPDRRVSLPTRYATLPAKNVPALFKETILEKCDLVNTEPFLVSGYGLVVNLDNTGDTAAPNAVRQYMVKEMDKHKWGSSLTSVKTPQPIEALRDPRLAIVQVDGYLPPG